MGVWLGGAIFADIAVTQNFATVDRFLGGSGQRVGLARNWTQSGATASAFCCGGMRAKRIIFCLRTGSGLKLSVAAVLLFGSGFSGHGRQADAGLGVLLMLIDRCGSAFPPVTAGNDLAGADCATCLPENPSERKVLDLHGIYSGSEILKLLIGAALGRGFPGARRDTNHCAKKYATESNGNKRG